MLAALLMTMVMPAVQAADARQPILLNEEEQGFVLNEMRQYVASVQQILTALANDDVITVGQGQLGMPTHKAFDEIADAAESGETTPQILSRLGTVLNNCVACHASYRLAPAAQGQ
jgi:mono/diheme cytochrome c family protein